MNWFWLGLAYLSLFFLGLSDNCRGPLFPDVLEQFKLTDAQGSWFFVVSAVVGLANNLAAGIWLARLGVVHGLALYSLLMGLALILMAWAHNYLTLLVGVGLLGIGMAGQGVCQNLLAGACAHAGNRRRVFSGLHCMYGLASLLAPLLVSGVRWLHWHWSLAFAVLALGPLIITFLSLRKSIDVPAAARPVRSEGDWQKSLWAATMLSAYVAAEILISTRLVLFARRDHAYSADAANLLLGTFFLMLFVGRLGFALYETPWRTRQILWVSAASTLLLLVLGILTSPWFLALSGLSMSVFYPTAMSLLAEELSEQVQQATSWCVAGSSLFLIVMHPLVGRLSDLYGLGFALWIGPLMLGVVMVFLLFPRRIDIQK